MGLAVLPAVPNSVLPLNVALAALTWLFTFTAPPIALNVAFPVVVTGPPTVRLPVVLVTWMAPLPVVALLIVAPSSSVTVMVPVPLPVSARLVALVFAATAPFAAPAVSATRFPLTLPPPFTILPAVAVNVAFPVVVTGPPMLRSPVVLVTWMAPLPVVALLIVAPSPPSP